MGFSQNLGSLMDGRGMTPYRLAKNLGCSQSTIAHWLAGDTMPQRRALKALSEEFGCSVEYLLRENDGEMDTVERIKNICKSKRIAISRLEKDLGFANGYIGQLRKGQIRADRLFAIAEYLGVSAEELTGEQKEKPTTSAGDGLSIEKRMLIDMVNDLTDEDALRLLRVMRAILADG